MISLGRLDAESLPFDARELYAVLARLAARSVDWAGGAGADALAALETLREPLRTVIDEERLADSGGPGGWEASVDRLCSTVTANYDGAEPAQLGWWIWDSTVSFARSAARGAPPSAWKRQLSEALAFAGAHFGAKAVWAELIREGWPRLPGPVTEIAAGLAEGWEHSDGEPLGNWRSLFDAAAALTDQPASAS